MASGIIIKDSIHFNRYTCMDKIFQSIEEIVPKYNWLITDIECNKDTEFFWYPWKDQYYEGRKLLKHLNENDIQFIWGVFTAIPKETKLSKEELTAINKPYGDGNRELWSPEITIQHPLGDIEIVCWDSTLTLVKSKSNDVIERFYKDISDAMDLRKYNNE